MQPRHCLDRSGAGREWEVAAVPATAESTLNNLCYHSKHKTGFINFCITKNSRASCFVSWKSRSRSCCEEQGGCFSGAFYTGSGRGVAKGAQSQHYDELEAFMPENMPAEKDVCCGCGVLGVCGTTGWLGMGVCWCGGHDTVCWLLAWLLRPDLGIGGCRYSCRASANTSIRSSLRYARQLRIKLCKIWAKLRNLLILDFFFQIKALNIFAISLFYLGC